MKISILPIGEIEENALKTLQGSLVRAFSGSTCKILSKSVVPKESYNIVRRQYDSTLILHKVLQFTEASETLRSKEDHILGVTDVDIYVQGLNFVFGEAQCPGKAAVISLYRLRPEFYGAPNDERLFLERTAKEAIHELGHTLGLRHCSNPLCVMHFSLNIGMTDLKQAEFCSSCKSLLNVRN